MDWLGKIDFWMHWLWTWIDWLWAGAWLVAGVLATHLFWWRRHSRLTEEERAHQDQLVRIDGRQREIRRQMEELTRREGSLKKMEENLRQQTEQLMPQIEQIRGWLDQISKGKVATDGDRPEQVNRAELP
ncbi:MAG: hypothetical protein IH614_19625 [Desulfuromonadales bacterium]|nr:hypothetical protein [Desulfuromonadales bacterium]